MKNNLKQIRFVLQGFMMRLLYGRNGFDNLARLCYGLSMILLVVNIFASSVIIYFTWIGLFAYSMFRTFSKNITKRYAENKKYLEMTNGIRKRAGLVKLQWRDRKTSRYYICKSCHQQIRVPKGKGRIEIRCPKCSERFIKRT
ncbi:hypothetical protein D6855_08280 [Butyrivibrio sp. CB08]|uniref:hypothetical protein n=1 Tax=Butyrivibrio sp. CB08 TaxID=2364879 RepID=UPI000EAA8790|nr:hypothetical protein [Butyrivibrio sp. CB08]RKM59776.1 hypothetical protein D6855_08280 [Butyrivibrio sp. CB08]